MPAPTQSELAALLNEAQRLAQRQNLAEALALLDRHARHPQFAFHRGHLLALLKRWAEAEAAFRLVLAAVPDQVDALLGLGGALIELGRPAEALAPLERVLARGAHPQARYLRAVALDESGRGVEAEAELAAARAAVIAPAEQRGLKPWEVYVQLSRRCNLRCTMCGHEVWQSNSGFMEAPVFERVVEQCRANGIDTLHVLSGQGEPFLHPQAFELLEHAVKAGLKVGIVTNGTPFTPERIDRLAGLGLAYVQFSFGGWDKDSYESVYVGAKFERTLENLLAMNRAMPPGHRTMFGVKAVTAGDWVNSQQRTKDFLASQGVDRVWMVVANNFGGTVKTGALHPRHGIWTMRALDHHRRMPCRIALKSVGIFCDGTVTACGCYDSNAELKLGNIMEADLADIRRGESFRAMLDGFRSGDLSAIPMCRDCDDPFG